MLINFVYFRFTLIESLRFCSTSKSSIEHLLKTVPENNVFGYALILTKEIK